MLHNPAFHMLYQSVRRCLEKHAAQGTFGNLSPGDLRNVIGDIEGAMETAAKAFDACKTGKEISMRDMRDAMAHAWWDSIKTLRRTNDETAANRAFHEAMRPHFEIRLF